MVRGQFLLETNHNFMGGNIYANRSSLVLHWLLKKGVTKPRFSLREVAQEAEVSLGLVQSIFKALLFQGVLSVKGIRTAKHFSFNHPQSLLEHWTHHYAILKKCKVQSYRSAFPTRQKLLERLCASEWHAKTALALHTAAAALGCSNTNLNTLELYALDHCPKDKLEAILELEPQERGYDVLLIQPYYKAMLHASPYFSQGIRVSPPLLTFLDLYHFPLRGLEQAERLALATDEIKILYQGLQQ